MMLSVILKVSVIEDINHTYIRDTRLYHTMALRLSALVNFNI